MKKLFFIISFLIFSCSENKVSIDIPTLSKYNIISDYSDVADTLNVYLNKAVGISLEISDKQKKRSIILVEKTDLNKDFISIDYKDSLITISANNKRNLYYATYDFIEKFLNVNWLSNDFTYYEDLKSINFPKNYSYYFEPPVLTRTVHSKLFYKDSVFADKLKVTNEAFPRYVPSARVHTFHRFLPYEVFYDKNPEYYALRNGKRLPTQLCLTNTDVLKIVKDSVNSFFNKSPNSDVISVSQDDNTQYCQCDKCSKIDNHALIPFPPPPI